ncbi:MAG: cobalamin B12-binding domain-containing protein [Desulfobacterales bacterium]|nr:cobalamin B12-binding domain-containing protein [Desulfobacterales bacterium]
MFDKDKIESPAEKQEEWEEKREKKALEKLGERQNVFETHSQIPVKRLYTPKDIQDFDYERDAGFPGDYPFTRGIYPVGYRSRTWQARQVCGFGTPEEITKTAVEEDVDILGLSFHSSTHLVEAPKIMRLLKEKGRDDLTVVVGGCIPLEDVSDLKKMGVREVFGSGSSLDDIVDFMIQ